MEKFQELLAEAAQLKQSQLKKERKNYESLPQYLKSGLNYAKKYKILRKQHYIVQMTLSEKLKKDGNKLFTASLFNEALNKYEQSLGIFRFIDAKTYDNMKDEDMIYELYTMPESVREYSEQYSKHLIALYLNICSCLTKLNKKDDAVHSADQALKIQQTAKAFYKKAQAYLKYINRETADIKLGFYYLNKSYQLSKDPSIIEEMHKIKKQIDQEKQKEQKWFKFMFDKNSQQQSTIEPTIKPQQLIKKQQKPVKIEPPKSENLKNLEKQQKENVEKQDEKLQKTKQKLQKFTLLSYSEQQWIELYEGQFILKHGSKIYSIIQVYGYKEYLGEYKSLLAQCLQFKKQQKYVNKRKELYNKYFQWLNNHPIDKIEKYIERYKLQMKWIQEQRNKKHKLLQKNQKTIQMPQKQVIKNIPQQLKGIKQVNQKIQQQDKQEIVEQSRQKIQKIQQTLDSFKGGYKGTTRQSYKIQNIDQKPDQEWQSVNQKEIQSTIKQSANPYLKYIAIIIAIGLITALKLFN